MNQINIYALKSKEGYVHPYLMTSCDDKDACKFCIEYFTKVVEEVKVPQEKQNMIESIRECTFVKLGFCNLLTGALVDEFNTLLELRDFMVEVKKNVD